MSTIKTSHSCSILSSVTNNKYYYSGKNKNGCYFSIINNDNEEIDNNIKKTNSYSESLKQQEELQSPRRELFAKKRSFSTSRLYNRNFING